jgi:hypothetical protein
MVARVASFDGIDVEAAQRTMEDAEAVIRPMVQALAGYQGRLDLARADGKYISVTFFDSAENARAAEPTFDEEMPRKLGEIFDEWSGRRLSVDVYDVVGEDRR